MIRPLTIILVLILAGTTLPAQTNDESDEYYGKISRSMEAFGAVFRDVATDYVDPTDPEKIIQAGIRGMLKELDPYSVYMVGDETESINRLSSGQYVGFGFTIGSRNGKLTILDVRPGYPAANAGIRRGDILYSVEGFRVDTIGLDSLRRHTRGSLGSSSQCDSPASAAATLQDTSSRGHGYRYKT